MKNYQFIREIANLVFVEKIILYGSRARATANEKSDIDLAIECPDAKVAEWLKVLELVEKADTLLTIDCLRLDSLSDEDALKRNIFREGKIIYDKNQGGFMSKEYWKDAFDSLGLAVARLREAYDKANSQIKEVDIYRDATIQRFEFTVELFWKVLKKFLSYEQINANTPREVLQESYKAQIITQEETWLSMMSDRNLTSHTYKEALAKEIFTRIQMYLPVLEGTYQKLQQRYKQMP